MTDARTFYETPEGVIAKGGFGRAEVIVRAARTPGLLFIKIQRETPGGDRWFQFIELDAEMARLLACKLERVASEIDASGAGDAA